MEATGARIIKYGKPDAVFSIYDIADIHWGNRGCSKSHLQRDVERIKNDPCALWYLGGDYLDAIPPSDAKRFDPLAYSTDITVNDLADLAGALTCTLIDALYPIKEKCIGALLGNHEHEYMRRENMGTIHEGVCGKIGAPNMMYTGWADLYFVHVDGMEGVEVQNGIEEPPTYFTARLRTLVSHGFGGAQTAGGKVNALVRLMEMSHDADLVIMGHLHEMFAKASVRLQPDYRCRKISERSIMGFITGTYLRGYASGFVGYGEKRGYRPTVLGAARATYSPLERRLIVESAADNIGMGMGS